MMPRSGARIDGDHSSVDWENLAPWRGAFSRRVIDTLEGGRQWWAAHWLWVTNAAVGTVLLGAFAAPVFAASGQAPLAQAMHRWYLLLCVQNPSHSYFLLGQQTALEHREIAMFSAQLLVGLTFVRLRERPGRPLVGWTTLVLCSLPMAWDALSQMAGLRDSDWFTRSWTGALFMAAYTLWFYPYLDRAFGYQRLPWRLRVDSSPNTQATEYAVPATERP